MKQWNEIFKKEGKVFLGVKKELPDFVKMLKQKGSRRVLDLGSGSGRHVIYFAKEGFDTFGIDIAEEGIKITKDWLKKENLKADLKIGNIYEKLPYANNFFDAILTTGVICHSDIGGIRKTIKEMERILKPQGLIFVNVRKNRKYSQVGSNKVLPFGAERTLCKITSPRTCVPLEGGEKGLIHYNFTKDSLINEFKNFKIQKIWEGSDKRHLNIIAVSKKE
jgi:ubiquinone/menaquinone biosynthesis C-methylase UbiE